jgi:hypothetical protein
MEDQLVANPIKRITKTQKHTKISVFRVEFKLTTPEFELAKTVHALGRATTVMTMT